VISFVRAIAYFTRERSSVGIWPLAMILFLTSGSFTETYYLNYNTLEWILLIAAIVYSLQIPVVRTRVSAATGVEAMPAVTRVRKRNDRL
jgi:hypothetical protein